MPGLELASMQSEQEFVSLIDVLIASADPHKQLTDLLREDHQIYEQRGTATIVRMRGWILLAFAKVGLSEAALLFVLEELDTGTDAYLIATAARALRQYPRPRASLAPYVQRALARIRYHDEPVSFEEYGEYSFSAGTSAVRELLLTLAWLGPHAKAILPELESLREQGAFPHKLKADLENTVEVIRSAEVDDSNSGDCCDVPESWKKAFFWSLKTRRNSSQIESTVFEDQYGESISFNKFFQGRPSIVAFFYTRCDNPLKCSLTITKLGRIQRLLKEQKLAHRIRTAAITYDPAFDLPQRIRVYGEDRYVLMDHDHRMLRATAEFGAVREYFKLGINFVESLVNRHRIEVYVLDAHGRIAATFQRIHWNEQDVVDCAVGVLKENVSQTEPQTNSAVVDHSTPTRNTTWAVFGTLSSLGVAFFPKCPVCWSAYLGFFGIAGLSQIPYSPWLRPVMLVVMLINLVSVYLRGRSTGRMSGFWLVSAGGLTILTSSVLFGIERVALAGIVLTLAGSLLSAWGTKKVRTR